MPPSALHSNTIPSPATASKEEPSPTTKESFAKRTEVGGAEILFMSKSDFLIPQQNCAISISSPRSARRYFVGGVKRKILL